MTLDGVVSVSEWYVSDGEHDRAARDQFVEAEAMLLEAALLALARIEWRVLGSELEAAFEELRLIRALQPRPTPAVAGSSTAST